MVTEICLIEVRPEGMKAVSSELHMLLAKIPISELSVMAVVDRRVDAMILLRIV